LKVGKTGVGKFLFNHRSGFTLSACVNFESDQNKNGYRVFFFEFCCSFFNSSRYENMLFSGQNFPYPIFPTFKTEKWRENSSFNNLAQSSFPQFLSSFPKSTTLFFRGFSMCISTGTLKVVRQLDPVCYALLRVTCASPKHRLTRVTVHATPAGTACVLDDRTIALFFLELRRDRCRTTRESLQ
jgi:hypothetical protein